MTLPSSSCIVMGLPRAGTSLLCNLLERTGVAGRPNEYLWRDEEGKLFEGWRVEGDESYLNRIIDLGTTPNGVFGLKLMWTYLDDAIGFLRRATGSHDLDDAVVLERAFPAPRCVSIRRKDVVAQAVSWAKAVQTEEWYAGDPARVSEAPSFDLAQIRGLVSTTQRLERFAHQWFKTHEIEPLEVTYEELVSYMDGTTRRVLEFLEQPAPDGRIEPSLRPQADSINAEWVSRYLDACPPK